MTTPNWQQHITEETVSTPDMIGHGARYTARSIAADRAQAIHQLQVIAYEARQAEPNTDGWNIQTGGSPETWAIVFNRDALTVEWVTGPHSWQKVEAAEVIGQVPAAMIINHLLTDQEN